MSRPIPHQGVIERRGMEVHQNFFPLPLLCDLNQLVRTQVVRKQMFTIGSGDQLPEPIASAAALVGERTGFHTINTAILKRYEPGEPSRAYEPHYDPDDLEDALVMASLGNVALFSVDLPSGQHKSIVCGLNTLIVIPTGLQHTVSPPLRIGVMRPFLFLGHRSTEA